MSGKDARIGLALGGGGARGWAHLGVLTAMAEKGLRPAGIAGTSMGALVGGFAAADKLDDLREIARELDLRKVVSLFAETAFPRSGIVNGKKIMAFAREYLGAPDIGSLPIPFRAVATDIQSGEEVVLAEGDLVDAIRASIAIPGIFTPVRHGDRYLADGGLVTPLPLEVARGLEVDTVIAVDLHGDWPQPTRFREKASKVRQAVEEGKLPAWWAQLRRQFEDKADQVLRGWSQADEGPNLFAVLGNTIDIVSAQRTRDLLADHQPDLLIQPELGDIGHMEFHRAEEAIEAGYEAGTKALADAGY
jgi:NTE family protein